MNHGGGVESRNGKDGHDSRHCGTAAAEETLDPENWDALRKLGHRMLDDMFDSMATVRDRVVWQPMPEVAKSRLRTPVPLEPTNAEQVYEDS